MTKRTERVWKGFMALLVAANITVGWGMAKDAQAAIMFDDGCTAGSNCHCMDTGGETFWCTDWPQGASCKRTSNC